MAKQLVIASSFYRYECWQIDCLTGELTGASAPERRAFNNYPGKRWRIQDADGDGRVTFYDLKALPLLRYPSPKGDQGARFVMTREVRRRLPGMLSRATRSISPCRTP